MIKKLFTSLQIYADAMLQEFSCYNNSALETVADLLENPQEITLLFTDL